MIYIVERLSDLNEGRGPMKMVENSGYFENEDDAWAFADTLTGVQCRKPKGSWRNAVYLDVRVVSIPKHDSAKISKIRELENKIKTMEDELYKLKVDRARF